MSTIRWGILSTANIAQKRLIPAIQASVDGEVVALASRNAEQAAFAASALGIARSHGSYEALLADPDVDAIYNPLPNHLHVEWSLKALAAGKHVLCEKPLGLDSADAERLVRAAKAEPRLKVMEAFMYRFHPQWQLAQQHLRAGDLGQVRHIHSRFAYHNADPDNIRNRADIPGGGGLMDIGCYSISSARWVYDSEPLRVVGHMSALPGFDVDCVTSGLLEFPDGTASFTCSTKTEAGQWLDIQAEQGSLQMAWPFNAEPDRDNLMWIQRRGTREELCHTGSDQYRLMVDALHRSMIDNTPVPTPLSDAIANMRVIDALVTSAREGRWVELD